MVSSHACLLPFGATFEWKSTFRLERMEGTSAEVNEIILYTKNEGNSKAI